MPVEDMKDGEVSYRVPEWPCDCNYTVPAWTLCTTGLEENDTSLTEVSYTKLKLVTSFSIIYPASVNLSEANLQFNFSVDNKTFQAFDDSDVSCNTMTSFITAFIFSLDNPVCCSMKSRRQTTLSCPTTFYGCSSSAGYRDCDLSGSASVFHLPLFRIPRKA